ncbi:hypothetical protein FD724_09740 [Nostoc sp. C057]|uniref:hypothetical protein n=1 Tax=Nostoc sp. C057 TaxID=2576903 RepID=UPI0015C30503|nr:hypothetical protein [Nostoc sp. C057]QLE48374.1 hypothetical protein FD724_09740 [Nostoc sp. C057]
MVVVMDVKKRCLRAGYAYAWHHINRELLLPRLQYLNETWSTKIVCHHLYRIYAKNPQSIDQNIVGAIDELPG